MATEQSFKISPVRPVHELIEESVHQIPPKLSGDYLKSDFVDLQTLDEDILFDIRYATDNNFVGYPVYRQPKAYLQQKVAAALLRAHKRLKEQNLGLIVYDAYRPWHVTWVFWHATPDGQKIFVADPADGSKHNRGAAIDVGMYNLKTEEPCQFPSGFDEMTPRAFSDYAGGTKQEMLNRKILREAMEAEGFSVHPNEWWHFDHADWERYPIENISFAELTFAASKF